MDRAVLDAYGWTDICPTASSSSTTRRTKRTKAAVAPQEALALPLARRRPRRGPRPPAGTERATCRRGTPQRLAAEADGKKRGSRRRHQAKGATQPQRQPGGELHQRRWICSSSQNRNVRSWEDTDGACRRPPPARGCPAARPRRPRGRPRGRPGNPAPAPLDLVHDRFSRPPGRRP